MVENISQLVTLIKESGLFEEKWYLRQYRDVGELRIDPVEHYLRWGAEMGRDPSPRFNSLAYLRSHPDVAKARLNPLVHYVKYGRREGRKVHRSRLASAGKGAGPVPSEDYAGQLQRSITAFISRARQEHASPYHDMLRLASEGVSDPELLAQVRRTLEDVDMRRLGTIPRAGGPVVSVVMPVWNRAGVVEAAIRSVLAQTYQRFELLICDDASDDESTEVITRIGDERITLLRQPSRCGAAAARNRCLAVARGDLIAYLDSDNAWHPRYLELMVEVLTARPGHVAAFAGYFVLEPSKREGGLTLARVQVRKFHLEDQVEKPFVDLNSFVHRRALADVFGGFDESLERRQDYDLIARYCWTREPAQVDYALNLYRRDESLNQITFTHRWNKDVIRRVDAKIRGYYDQGLPARFPSWLRSITVISWDMSRNHFAKAYSVAEALSRHLDVQLVSFRFFDEEIFAPLANASPSFRCDYFDGRNFPEFFDDMTRAIQSIRGDAIYCVKPRLSSFGLAMLANFHTGKPVFLEANDLETVVASPGTTDVHLEAPLSAVFERMEEAAVPHADIWSQVLDPCVDGIPVIYTHNINLNIHYRSRALYMRNVKDEGLYSPARIDRSEVRADLGFQEEDRVILFGGLVRKHKGIFEQLELLERLNDSRYKLLVVGSRETPDLRKLTKQQRDSIRILPPQPPSRMAELNAAADLVLLWLDPRVPAGHYQSPYKMTDAFAMGATVIGSPMSDLPDFALRRLAWTVPFGDFDALVRTIREVFDASAERDERRRRARRMFEREFSYHAVGPAIALGASLLERHDEVYPVSRKFAEFFSEFHSRMTSGT